MVVALQLLLSRLQVNVLVCQKNSGYDFSHTQSFKILTVQYLCNIWRKKQDMKLGFLHADKHQSLLQVDTIFFDGFGQA